METINLKSVIEAIVNSTHKEAIDLVNEKYPNGMDFSNIQDLKSRILHPAQQLMKGIFIQKYGDINWHLEFIINNNDFIEHHFRFWIEKIEGMSSCADKTRYILKSLVNWLLHKKEIIHDYSGEYTYHLPKIIFRIHNEIIDFFNALISLFYGNSELYLKMIKLFIDAKYSEISELKKCHSFVTAIQNNDLDNWHIPETIDIQKKYHENIERIKELIEKDTEKKLPEEIVKLYI